MHWIERYLNAKVTIHYSESAGMTFTDTGRLANIDNCWVELIKDNGDRLLAPISNIRIIKIIELPETLEESTLLRAASSTAAEEDTEENTK